MHKTLERQLKRLNLSKSNLPPKASLWKNFLKGVDNFYQSSDHDRYLLEQALNISSEEMQERWERINKLLNDNEKHICTLKSQNKVLSSISEDCDFSEILKILVHEMISQLNLKKVLMIQRDSSKNILYIVTSDGPELTDFSELSLKSEQSASILEFFQKNEMARYKLLENKTDFKVFQSFFKNCGNIDRLWYIPIPCNNQNYPSYLFLLPEENEEPTDHESEVLNSLIQVINIIIYHFEAKRRLEEEQVKVIYAGKKAALGEMAGGIAHEINNPLAIISGQTQKLKLLAKIGKIDTDNLNDSADKILKTIDRLSRIVYALRAFSRDDTKISKSVSNVVEIMDDSLALCSEKIKNSGVELRTKYANEELHTFCNSVQISQVIVNLISNAYDAIYQQENPWISIEVFSDEETITLVMTDSGNGIPEDIQEKIMLPFFTTKEIGHGTGIGLSLSQGIVKEHKGTLEYNNQSKNTQFVIHLPLSQNLKKELKVAS